MQDNVAKNFRSRFTGVGELLLISSLSQHRVSVYMSERQSFHNKGLFVCFKLFHEVRWNSTMERNLCAGQEATVRTGYGTTEVRVIFSCSGHIKFEVSVRQPRWKCQEGIEISRENCKDWHKELGIVSSGVVVTTSKSPTGAGSESWGRLFSPPSSPPNLDAPHPLSCQPVGVSWDPAAFRGPSHYMFII